MLVVRWATVLLLLGQAAGTNEVGKKFLEEVAGKPGVVKLPSGLMYKVIRTGGGQHHPTPNSPCECHYAGTTPSLTPGVTDKDESQWKEFDSSYKRGKPTTFAPNQVIKGWTEAMQLMVEGDKWEMYIPSELGYGEKGAGAKIKPGDVLIFRMEIIKIKGDKKEADRCNIDTLEGCDEKQKQFILKHKDSPEKDKIHKSLEEELKKSEEKHPDSKPHTKNWLADRMKLLKKMINQGSQSGDEL
eukprot:CAMPEP_0178417400 /NCGR_PEP_ID=MMETSP0689_2-20121128/24553_1 /TAXON_ID=160604 /ORGANISM="Amphidinium massartii, Strain CS-259" /LENGTH=242 /DNA_ID=CAMNT_0020038761 /DNA_START=69 /DNA_END=797 /DNA_ORIENTATION=-